MQKRRQRSSVAAAWGTELIPCRSSYCKIASAARNWSILSLKHQRRSLPSLLYLLFTFLLGRPRPEAKKLDTEQQRGSEGDPAKVSRGLGPCVKKKDLYRREIKSRCYCLGRGGGKIYSVPCPASYFALEEKNMNWTRMICEEFIIFFNHPGAK